MEERILKLKEIYNQGIDRKMFFKLILHSTDGNSEPTSVYANNKSAAEWMVLYNEASVALGVSVTQMELFFNYMSAYHHHFFGREQGKYSVNKYFNKKEKARDNFEFEEITLTVLELA